MGYIYKIEGRWWQWRGIQKSDLKKINGSRSHLSLDNLRIILLFKIRNFLTMKSIHPQKNCYCFGMYTKRKCSQLNWRWAQDKCIEQTTTACLTVTLINSKTGLKKFTVHFLCCHKKCTFNVYWQLVQGQQGLIKLLRGGFVNNRVYCWKFPSIQTFKHFS